jgi:L-asparaginase
VEVVRQISTEKWFESFSTEILQNMKKIKIVWYWNSRLRCFDQNGKIAAATSTGGKGFEVPGRISDSATVAGNYANPFCGVNRGGIL